ncbi:MAG: hypothetical protein Q4F11_01330 [Eubacteriales bacterium]|nr:hypothetical protein [Eubacteriales bacterium]
MLILVIAHCICTNLFSIFTPAEFTPPALPQPSETDSLTNNARPEETSDSLSTAPLNSRQQLEELYRKGTRFVHCTIPVLYYSGYDNTSFNKVTGHYYYSLDDSSCTIYLLPCSITDGNDTVPLTITDLSFNARLNRSDTNLKDLLRYISADINWNYYSLSQCAGPIVVDQTQYPAFQPIAFIAAIIGLSVINIVQLINIKRLL